MPLFSMEDPDLLPFTDPDSPHAVSYKLPLSPLALSHPPPSTAKSNHYGFHTLERWGFSQVVS